MGLIGLIWLIAAAPAAPGPATYLDTSGFPQITLYAPVDPSVEGLRVTESDETATALPSGMQARLKLAIVLDSSGSTWGKLSLMKTGIVQLADLLPEGAETALVDVDSSPRVVCPFTPLVADLADTLPTVTADGGSAIYDGLVEGLKLCAETTGWRAVLLVTDGRHEGGLAQAGDVGELARQLGCALLIAGVGVDVDATGLRELAEATGGVFLPAPRAEKLPGELAELAQDLGDARAYAYTSPRPEADGTPREVAWRTRSGARGTGEYGAPWARAEDGAVTARCIDAVGEPVSVLVRVLAESRPETSALLIANGPPLPTPAGGCRVQVLWPGRPEAAGLVQAEQVMRLAFAQEGRLLIQAPLGPLGEPASVRVRDSATGDLVGQGFAGSAIGLPVGDYSLSIGTDPRIVKRGVTVLDREVTVVAAERAATLTVVALDADGEPVKGSVRLIDPASGEPRHAGRLNEPLSAEAGDYVLDWSLPHATALEPFRLEAGATVTRELPTVGRLRLQSVRPEGMPPPVAFLEAKDAKGEFALGSVEEAFVGPGEYALRIATLPPLTAEVRLGEGETVTVPAGEFGRLTVTGPEDRDFRVRRDADEEWVGVFPCGEPVYLAAGIYAILPDESKPEQPPQVVQIDPGQETPITLAIRVVRDKAEAEE